MTIGMNVFSVYRFQFKWRVVYQCMLAPGMIIRVYSFFAANFSKFRGPVCQIPQFTAANFPHVAIFYDPERDSICSNHFTQTAATW